MSYEVKFRTRDQASVSIDNEKGEKLKALWFDENQRNTPVEIANNAYVIGDIKAIVHIADPPIVDPFQTRLPEGKQCRGEFSIQNEINKVIKDEYPGKWAKKIADKPYRESIRKKLRSQKGVMWCDAKAQECACS